MFLCIGPPGVLKFKMFQIVLFTLLWVVDVPVLLTLIVGATSTLCKCCGWFKHVFALGSRCHTWSFYVFILGIMVCGGFWSDQDSFRSICVGAELQVFSVDSGS